MWKPRSEMPIDWFDLKIFSFFSLMFISVIVLQPSFSMAFEVKTHRQITEKAIEAAESTLDTYLTGNLGLEGGLNASIDGMTSREWMIKGSEFEDEDGFARPLNHFHDPISDAGLTGLGESAIDWSLQPVGEQRWSWNDAREYYFKALTSPTKAERDENLGKTFRALGQIMHLIQDMASPAHVRNDPHLSYGGNGDTDGLHDFMEKQDVGMYTGLGIFGPDSSILEQPGAIRSEPFANLFDFNQYSGSNPEVTVGRQVGLAEYANANFFSDDRIQSPTNFISGISPFFRLYEHPSLAELVPAPSPSPYLTLPRLGSASFPGARVAKYTGNQALAKFTLAHLQYDLIGQLQLDDAVYDAYSTHLIPRAVGYSAAVLKYFFRSHIPFEEFGYCYQPRLNAPGIFTVLENPLFWPPEFKDGNLNIYYDRSDGMRVFYDNNIPEGDLNPGDPITLTLAYQGRLGPDGAEEPQAVVGDTHTVTYFFEPCLQ